MEPQISFGKFVTIGLIFYFAFVIIRANNKLQSDQVGTMFRRVRDKTTQEN